MGMMFDPSHFYVIPTHQAIKEEIVNKVFKEYGFYYPIEISFETSSPLEGFPWIRPSQFLEKMGELNDLGHILGGHSLEDAEGVLVDFWCKYREIVPEHEIFTESDLGLKDLKKCIPLYFHGDEGVSYKKDGVLVLSFQGAFGYGSSQRGKEVEENYRAMGEGIPLNFLKTGMQTRMLILVCPKEWGSKTSVVQGVIDFITMHVAYNFKII